MRFLYLTIGMLSGLAIGSQAGLVGLAMRDKAYDSDITAYTLTGFAEGWTRGRDYTEAKMNWMVAECFDELNHCSTKGR